MKDVSNMVNALVRRRRERRIARRRLCSRLATQCRKNYARLVEMFELGCTFEQIRNAIVPDLSKWTEMPPNIVRTELNRAIALTLGFQSISEYAEAHGKMAMKVHRKRRDESGWPEARRAALQRDGHKCVISGRTTNLEVHHIDGDSCNNQLDNLITLHRDYHQGIAHTRSRLNGMDRLRMTEYIQYLQSHGYPNTELTYCEHCRRYHATARR